MRQFLLGLSISVAFILGCVTAQHVPGVAMPSASASTTATGQHWEYVCDPGVSLPVGFKAKAEKASEYLNQFGADGWEYIPGGYQTVVCFKRVR